MTAKRAAFRRWIDGPGANRTRNHFRGRQGGFAKPFGALGAFDQAAHGRGIFILLSAHGADDFHGSGMFDRYSWFCTGPSHLASTFPGKECLIAEYPIKGT
jgi:hypothetical protein